MEYITSKEAASKWNISERSVQNYCANEKITGAKRVGKQWMIPTTCERPTDRRSKSFKKNPEISVYHFPLFAHSTYYSSQIELSDEEKVLFDAQILYLTGNYFDCILKCRQIQSDTISRSIIFGAHCTIGYAAMLLGLYSEYQSSIYALEKIIKKETTHKEDYRLILVGLQAHATRNYSLISEIDTDKLSFDALYYYKYILMMNSLVNLTLESTNSINTYRSLLRELEIQGITPSALCVTCILSFLYKRLDDKENQKYYMKKACDIWIQTGFHSIFTKYYLIAPELIDDCLLKYGDDYIAIMKKYQREIMLKWLIVHKLSSGFVPLPEFTVDQNEILVLMPGSVPLASIAKIKNIPLEKVEKEVNEILEISGVKSINELTKYARERFNEMPKDLG